jgi:hypothetical protein
MDPVDVGSASIAGHSVFGVSKMFLTRVLMSTLTAFRASFLP